MKASTKPIDESKYVEVMKLLETGMKISDIAKLTGINRSSISNWKCRKGRGTYLTPTEGLTPVEYLHLLRDGWSDVDAEDYSYILGLYLGDGCIYSMPRTKIITFTLDKKYPKLNEYTVEVLGRFFNKKPLICDRSKQNRGNAIDIKICSSKLDLIFPQHGRGVKHRRSITLSDWQINLINHGSLVKGLIMSDGCYYFDSHNKKHMYSFSNKSEDIVRILSRSLTELNIAFDISKSKNSYTLRVCRTSDVSKLFDLIGNKLIGV